MKTQEAIQIKHPAEALVLAKVAPAVIERVEKIRLMAFDVDGVLTDGSLWFGEDGEIVKQFNALDGHGLRLMREGGIDIALVTGREGPIVTRRAAELGISLVMQGVRDKAGALAKLAADSGYSLDKIGFMGDDILDLAALQKAGFAASVPGAPAYIQQAVHWVSGRDAGHGAVRECCDLILAAQGRLSPFLAPNAVILGGVTQ